MSADLHIHTTASDGLLSPAEIVREAKKTNLREIAITDHETIDGLSALLKAGFEKTKTSINGQNQSKMTIIPGVEISADFPEYDVHILGYFIDFENTQLKKRLEFLTNIRQERLVLMVERINSLGYHLHYDRVLDIAKGSAAIGRPHLAKGLVVEGYFKNVEQVFDMLIGRGCPAYIPKYKPPLTEVVELIRGAGGVAILAHPGLINDDCLVEKIAKTPGISGLEVYHPAHNRTQMKKYFSIAKEYNLKITGGSDYHGIADWFPEKLGLFHISTRLVTKLASEVAPFNAILA